MIGRPAQDRPTSLLIENDLKMDTIFGKALFYSLLMWGRNQSRERQVFWIVTISGILLIGWLLHLLNRRTGVFSKLDEGIAKWLDRLAIRISPQYSDRLGSRATPKTCEVLVERSCCLHLMCLQCSVEFDVRKDSGTIRHKCLKCGKVHEIWTGEIISKAGILDPHEVLRVNRISLKVDSEGRVRVLGEIENISDRAWNYLVLSFKIITAGTSHEVVAFPGLDIAGSQTEHAGGVIVRPHTRLQFHHWLIEMHGKIKGNSFSIKNIELTGQTV